jgi:hypothetical protein
MSLLRAIDASWLKDIIFTIVATFGTPEARSDMRLHPP